MPIAKHIQITLPPDLVEYMDTAAQEEYATRSEFIRRALMAYLAGIQERRARLQAISTSGDVPAEAELLTLLKMKQAQIWARRELRRAGFR